METTKNEMDVYSKIFFLKLGNYLDTQIYYFGSIQRNDYFPGKSDIDVDIFTDNVQSTIIKLQNFFGIEKYKFKRFVYKLHKTKKMVTGYKVKYEDPSNNFLTEISIYDEKDKEYVLIEHNSKALLPFYISWLLIILKTFYYKLGILSEDIYSYLKKIIIDFMVEGEDDEFVTIDVPEHKPDKDK
jgi:predicted nucleotidyltransferase